MTRTRAVVGAVGAVVVTVVLVVGVPVLLIVGVGNPWPGMARLEMRDEVAVVVGVLAVLAWVLWARFVVAMAMELRQQLTELRAMDRTRAASGRVALAPPPPARRGVGLLAQRLVAAALVVMPVTNRIAAASDVPTPLTVDRSPVARLAEPSVTAVAPLAPTASATTRPEITVGPGDTLIGLARTHLADGRRWREIYELNRDRPQPDGHRLLSPSGLRAGWQLTLPPPDRTAPASPYVAPDTVTVQPGDNLWALTETRLAAAGVAADDAAVAEHLQAVIVANADVVEDPNLIYAGEQFDFPAVGTPPPPAPPPAPPPPAAPPPDPELIEPAPIEPERVESTTVPSSTTATTSSTTSTPPTTSTTTTVAEPVPPDVEPDPIGSETVAPSSPAPIGIGEAALLSAGVLALVVARRRMRLRSARPRARMPQPPPETVATERRLRAVDAGERLLRVDVATRAAAASLVEGTARIALASVGSDGVVELTLTGPAMLPAPWEGAGDRWVLPGSTPVEHLADAARSVGGPCVALVQLGVDDAGREVLADLEALGVLGIAAPPDAADAVVRGIAAMLGSSVFAENANLIGVGVDEKIFLDHGQAHHAASVDEAWELAMTLVGTTASARHSTFVLRARHTSGEAWEPAVLVTGSAVLHRVTPELVEIASAGRGGLAMVTAGDVAGAPWSLRAGDGRWTLEPLGSVLVPVGLSNGELHDLHDVVAHADEPLIDADTSPPPAPISTNGDSPHHEPFMEQSWSLLVRMLGPVEVVDANDRRVRFERSKSVELVAWLALHRERSTRGGARTALWDVDVRDATFANVVSDARRAMARHVPPPDGQEWLGRTLTEILPLHEHVVSDVDLVRARLERSRSQVPEQAIETLRPAVELIRGLPFAGTGYLWPDAEGMTSNLVLTATSAATVLAGHYLSVGDIGGVFWATGQGLQVLPAHEELIALRMRAHHRAGDLSGVRLEWESYERALNADPWSGGEPTTKLVLLRRELLSS